MSSNGWHSKLARSQSLIEPEAQTPSQKGPPNYYQQMAKVLGGRLICNHAGFLCLVRTLYPSRYSHGEMVLSDIETDKSVPLSAFTRRKEPGFVNVPSLLFFDTETTGLGGTGTVAFLVGCGVVVEDGFEIRQYIIPDYSDETAMLEALLQEFSQNKVIVTYNGAAFDLPVLRDRMIINRVARELPLERHIDLLHPTRRLFRRRLGDCSLTNVERELFGFYRDNDLPSYLIPSIYFEWLNEQKLDSINAVLKHNQLDIISLYFLACYIAHIFQTEGESLGAVDDLHSLSRIYGWRKDNDKVVDLYRRIDTFKSRPLAEDILLYHAQAFKRIGAFDMAVALWERLSSSSSREGFWANIELAKYYEHRDKDVEKAYHYAEKADNIAPYSQRQKRLLYLRLARLRCKLAR